MWQSLSLYGQDFLHTKIRGEKAETPTYYSVDTSDLTEYLFLSFARLVHIHIDTRHTGTSQIHVVKCFLCIFHRLLTYLAKRVISVLVQLIQFRKW